MASGALVASGPGDLIFGFGVSANAAPGTGFTTLSTIEGNVTEVRTAGGSGTYQATATNQSTTNMNWTMLGATLRVLSTVLASRLRIDELGALGARAERADRGAQRGERDEDEAKADVVQRLADPTTTYFVIASRSRRSRRST